MSVVVQIVSSCFPETLERLLSKETVTRKNSLKREETVSRTWLRWGGPSCRPARGSWYHKSVRPVSNIAFHFMKILSHWMDVVPLPFTTFPPVRNIPNQSLQAGVGFMQWFICEHPNCSLQTNQNNCWVVIKTSDQHVFTAKLATPFHRRFTSSLFLHATLDVFGCTYTQLCPDPLSTVFVDTVCWKPKSNPEEPD